MGDTAYEPTWTYTGTSLEFLMCGYCTDEKKNIHGWYSKRGWGRYTNQYPFIAFLHKSHYKRNIFEISFKFCRAISGVCACVIDTWVTSDLFVGDKTLVFHPGKA